MYYLYEIVPSGPQASKIVQQSVERPSIAPSTSPPVNQPRQQVVAEPESASKATGVKDAPQPVQSGHL